MNDYKGHYTPSALEEHREAILSQLQWDRPKRGGFRRTYRGADVSITLQKSSNRKAICITFRNEVEGLIDPDNINHIATSINGRRIFFCADNGGYALSRNKHNKSPNKYMKTSLSDDYLDFIGDYELRYDDFIKLYFIEKEGLKK